jgi:peptidoglycan/LPS O-acetylase OafA/YrhL
MEMMTSSFQVSTSGSNTTTGKPKYRPEIDGLRAFAVVAVIINHFNKDLLPSGYLGVDIFFVISGYVITSSLAVRESKNFLDFLTGFYERRIKRLVPALVVFVLITSVLISLFNPDPDISLKTGASSLFGLSNLYLLKQSTDYFAESTELNPFTHTWSLGVEEQFYLLFPFLIWFSGFGQQKVRGAKNLFLWVGALTISSLIGFIYLYKVNQSAAYFLMPSRFWEMAAGCLIFIGFQKRAKIEQALEYVPPLLILTAMVGVMFLPVSAAVPATISIVALTVVLIACLKQGTPAYRFFTLESVVFIGLASYSLYLWHWSVLSISRWTIGIHWWSAPFQAGFILALSYLSWRYVETPIRRSSSRSIRGRLSIAILFLSFLGGFGLKTVSNRSDLPYLGDPDPVKREQDMSISGKSCKYLDDFPPCSSWSDTNETDSMRKNRQMIIVGDSHAERHVPLANSLSKRFGIKVSISAVPGYPFPPNKVIRLKDPQRAKTGYEKQLSSMSNTLKHLRRGDILTIINSGSYSSSIDKAASDVAPTLFRFPDKSWEGDNQPFFLARLSESLENIGAKMHEKGVYVIYFLPNPAFQETEISECFPQWYQALNLNPLCSEEQSRRKVLSKHEKTLFPSLQGLQDRKELLFFNPLNALCSADLCKRIVNGKQIYTDGSHLTIYASQLVAKDFADFLIKSGILE